MGFLWLVIWPTGYCRHSESVVVCRFVTVSVFESVSVLVSICFLFICLCLCLHKYLRFYRSPFLFLPSSLSLSVSFSDCLNVYLRVCKCKWLSLSLTVSMDEALSATVFSSCLIVSVPVLVSAGVRGSSMPVT